MMLLPHSDINLSVRSNLTSLNFVLRSMYQLNGRMQTLLHARHQTEIIPTVNRVRRVVRDQLTCGKELEIQNIRFDVQILSPNNLSGEAHERHLDLIRHALIYLLKGALYPKYHERHPLIAMFS